MIKGQLMFIRYKYSVYISISIFFIACFLGYVSNVSVDVLVKKAIIAGCGLGLAFFVLMGVLTSIIPDNINMIKHKNKVDGDISDVKSK